MNIQDTSEEKSVGGYFAIDKMVGKTITQIRKEARGETEKVKEKEGRIIRIMISRGNKVLSSMELPFKKSYAEIICKWLLEDVKTSPKKERKR